MKTQTPWDHSSLLSDADGEGQVPPPTSLIIPARKWWPAFPYSGSSAEHCGDTRPKTHALAAGYSATAASPRIPMLLLHSLLPLLLLRSAVVTHAQHSSGERSSRRFNPAMASSTIAT